MKDCRWQALVGVVLTLVVGPSLAEDPVAVFDTPCSIACRDVSPEAAEGGTNRKKTVEVPLPVTVRVDVGDESALDHVLIELRARDKNPTCRVVDFLPKTELYSDIVGPMIVVKKDDLSINGRIGAKYGVVAEAEVGADKSKSSSVSYKQLPPKHLLLASGRIERGSGVYFQLKPSQQFTLQGERSYSVLLEVPPDWRGDWVELRCIASVPKGVLHSILGKEPECGRARYAVGLYLEGDGRARQLAEDLAKKQQVYFDELEKELKQEQDGGKWDKLFRLPMWIVRHGTVGGASPALNDRLAEMLNKGPDGAELLGADAKKARNDLDAAKVALAAMSGKSTGDGGGQVKDGKER